MSQPDYTPQLPLSSFLLKLAAAGIHITLHDIRRVQRVLSTQADWTHTLLRTSLLVLLAKNETQRTLIDRLYHEYFQLDFYGDSSSFVKIDKNLLQRDLHELLRQLEPKCEFESKKPEHASKTKESSSAKKTTPQFFLISLVLLILLAINISFFDNEPHIKEPSAKTVIEREDFLLTEHILVQTPKASVVVIEDRIIGPVIWWFGSLWFGVLTIILFFAYLLPRLNNSHQASKLPPTLHWDKSGSVYFNPIEIGGRMPSWLTDETLNLCAEVIGYENTEEPSDIVDVVATVMASAQSSGQTEIRMVSKREVREVLILFNAQAPGQRWFPLPWELARGLRQRGISVTLGAMHGSLKVFRSDDGGWVSLEALAESKSYYVTLIFADADLPDWRTDALLLDMLAQFPELVWLTLRETRYWSDYEERLQAAGFDLQTAEPDQFISIFRELVNDTQCRRKKSLGYQRFMLREATEPLDLYVHRLLGDTLSFARIVAVLPPPVSPALLVKMLKYFSPKLSPTRLQRLYALPDTDVNASSLSLSYDVLKMLRAEFHEYVDLTHKQIIKVKLLSWFEEARPTETNSLRYFQWRWYYLRTLLEFEPDEAIPHFEQLQSLEFFRSRIEREFGPDALPIPLSNVSEENRKRLWCLSKGKTMNNSADLPDSVTQKRSVVLSGLLTITFVIGAIWLTLVSD